MAMKLEVIDKSSFNLNSVSQDSVNDYYFIEKLFDAKDASMTRLNLYNLSGLIKKLNDEKVFLVRINFE